MNNADGELGVDHRGFFDGDGVGSLGIGAPVIILMACPGFRIWFSSVPALKISWTGSATGESFSAPAKSPDLTAKPSMAELSNGGNFSRATKSIARTRPCAS